MPSLQTTEGLMQISTGSDGATHINCYSSSRTPLGRSLSNFSNKPIDHPRYGHFDCLEGYWYWLKTGKCKDVLRRGYGYLMKQRGKGFTKIHNPTFEAEFLEGIHLKLLQHPDLYAELLACTLPLAHYYEYTGLHKDAFVSSSWVWYEYDLIRKGKPLQSPEIAQQPDWV